ncbi:hypothetical protein ACQY0O_003656 [Thecaphora frezii]
MHFASSSTLLATLSVLLSLQAEAKKDGLVKKARSAAAAASGLYAPVCRTTGAKTFDVIDYGVNLSGTKSWLSFGDSWTACGGSNGRPCPPATLPNGLKTSGTSADFMYGNRASNGPTWVEDVAAKLGADLHNFAQGGAVVNYDLTSGSSANNDLRRQWQKWEASNTKFDPKTTVCSFFFGINDAGRVANVASDSAQREKLLAAAGDEELSYWPKLKGTVCNQLIILDTKATAMTDALKAGIDKYGATGDKVAYISVRQLFIEMDANYQQYGFSTNQPCVTVTGSTYNLECSTEQVSTAEYWIGHHPTGKSHGYIADFVEKSLTTCNAPNKAA